MPSLRPTRPRPGARENAAAPTAAGPIAACLAATLLCAGPAAAEREGRVVLLGFDGAGAEATRERMEAGDLPHLAALAESGDFAPSVSPPPADPVASWVALVSGLGPGHTGVFGSVRCELGPDGARALPGDGRREWRPIERYPLNPWPAWSRGAAALLGGAVTLGGFLFVLRLLLRLDWRASGTLSVLMGAIGAAAGWTARGYLPDALPRVESPSRAAPFWRAAEEAGVTGVVLGAPFEPSPGRGGGEPGVRVLAGRGFPDARGERGTWFLCSSRTAAEGTPPTGGRALAGGGVAIALTELGGKASTRLTGPENFAGGAGRATVPLAALRRGGALEVTLGNSTQRLEPGETSELYPLVFQLNPFLRVDALARARLEALDEDGFELIVGPLHVDPRSAPFWQSPAVPAGFGEELADAIGRPFGTCGFTPPRAAPGEPGWSDGALAVRSKEAWGERRAQLRHALASGAGPLVAAFFETPGDAAALPADHPARDEAYRRMDEVVGETMAALGEGDVLIVCSDRGSEPPRRVWHLNDWLAERGWLPEDAAVAGADGARFVDGSRAFAFAVGSGQVYLVGAPDDGGALLGELETELRGARDPATGLAPVLSIRRGAELYEGRWAGGAPDLVVGLAPPFALSDEARSGGLASFGGTPGAFADALPGAPPVAVDSARSRGFLCASLPLRLADGASASHLDLAPTVLAALGAPIPPALEGEPLLARP